MIIVPTRKIEIGIENVIVITTPDPNVVVVEVRLQEEDFTIVVVVVEVEVAKGTDRAIVIIDLETNFAHRIECRRRIRQPNVIAIRLLSKLWTIRLVLAQNPLAKWTIPL